MSEYIKNPLTGRLVKKGSKTYKMLINTGAIKPSNKIDIYESTSETDYETDYETKSEIDSETDSKEYTSETEEENLKDLIAKLSDDQLYEFTKESRKTIKKIQKNNS